MEMERFESSLIYARGYDPEKQLMNIRFKDPKSGSPTSLYQYSCIPSALYQQGLFHISDRTGELSFGQWFQKFIKPNPKAYPYRKIEDSAPREEDDFYNITPRPESIRHESTTDFSSGQPIPADTSYPEIDIPTDPEALKTAALDLTEKAKGITINSPEACELAMRTGIAIARMQAALETVFRPEIDKKHKAWKAELAILNHYNDPLESDKTRLKAGIVAFRREQQRIAEDQSRKLREEAQRQAEEEARQRAQELQLADAIEAEGRGEVEVAQMIMEAPALPLTPAYVAPIHVATNVPDVKGASHREDWQFEWVDKDGNPVDQPDMALLPLAYHLPDEKALKAMAKRLKNRTDIPGVRVYDAGNVSFRAK